MRQAWRKATLSHRSRDRANHVDSIVRPPPWVYKEIEEAIRHAIAGDHTAEIESRDGHRYVVDDLVERWELEDMLEVYRLAPDDPSYPS